MSKGYCGQCGGLYSDEVPCECQSQRRAGMTLPYGFAFRVDWRGKVILQTMKKIPWSKYGDFDRVWVDAKTTDLDRLYRAKGEQG